MSCEDVVRDDEFMRAKLDGYATPASLAALGNVLSAVAAVGLEVSPAAGVIAAVVGAGPHNSECSAAAAGARLLASILQSLLSGGPRSFELRDVVDFEEADGDGRWSRCVVVFPVDPGQARLAKDTRARLQRIPLRAAAVRRAEEADAAEAVALAAVETAKAAVAAAVEEAEAQAAQAAEAEAVAAARLATERAVAAWGQVRSLALGRPAAPRQQ
ncbi:hypothetical protein PLESTB_001356600 [Pleodorina starrii]|uniref:Uncharacterized protein n=1 Tax=Pleodorina starrii TaxID=330485 RepID=A0A9W6BUH0_9CHLO|nr:hypothetical protein PLESTM_001916400 [Pleodorina starrii]GLC58418.1 hypothetical protein PLESTB_001356600 [Pleodorina starrii]